MFSGSDEKSMVPFQDVVIDCVQLLMGCVSNSLSVRGSNGELDPAIPQYSYPSAGSLYPVQTYLVIPQTMTSTSPLSLPSIHGGYYYHHPDRNLLIPLKHKEQEVQDKKEDDSKQTKDLEQKLMSAILEILEIIQQSLTTNNNNKNNNNSNNSNNNSNNSNKSSNKSSNSNSVTSQPLSVIFLVGDHDAITPVYGPQNAHNFCLLEAGHIEGLMCAELALWTKQQQQQSLGQRFNLTRLPGSLWAPLTEQINQVLGLSPSHRILTCLVLHTT